MIEIYSKFYFLIMPVTVMLPSDKSQRFQDGNTLLACTYETSLKPYIYEYIYIYIYIYISIFLKKKHFKTTFMAKIRKEAMENYKFRLFPYRIL